MVETLRPPGELVKLRRIEKKWFECMTVSSPFLSILKMTPYCEGKRNRSWVYGRILGTGGIGWRGARPGVIDHHRVMLRDEVGRQRWGSTGVQVWRADSWYEKLASSMNRCPVSNISGKDMVKGHQESAVPFFKVDLFAERDSENVNFVSRLTGAGNKQKIWLATIKGKLCYENNVFSLKHRRRWAKEL